MTLGEDSFRFPLPRRLLDIALAMRKGERESLDRGLGPEVGLAVDPRIVGGQGAYRGEFSVIDG